MGKDSFKRIIELVLGTLLCTFVIILVGRGAILDAKADKAFVDEYITSKSELDRLEKARIDDELKYMDNDFNQKILEQEKRYNIRIDEINKAWDNRIEDLKDIIKATK